MSAPMSTAARWSTPGRRSAPARRSARTATCRAGSGSAACSSRCRPSRSSSRTIALSARAARSSRASSSRQGAVLAMGTFIGATTKIVDRDDRRNPSSAGCRPIRSSCRVRCPASALPDGQPGPSLYCAVIVKTGRRADPRQDLDQRAVARMSERRAARSGGARRRADPPAERHAEGRGRARHRRRARCEQLGFTCHPPDLWRGATASKIAQPLRPLRRRPPESLLCRPHRRRADRRRRRLVVRAVRRGRAGRRAVRPRRRRHEGRDRRLYRRGASAFSTSAEPDFAGSISLLITGDEEGVAVNGTRKVLEWLTQRGETLDACLVGEPTSATALGDMIKIGRRGSMTGRLTVAWRAGPHRLPAPRRQRCASAGRACCMR